MYYKTMCIAPLVMFGFAVLVYLINRPKKKKKKVKENIIAFLISFVYMFYIGLPFVHGVHLFWEKEEESVELIGTITDIKDTHGINKYRHNDHVSFASYIYIDDKKLYIMCIDDYQIGDEVVVEYLPKSTVVLSMRNH